MRDRRTRDFDPGRALQALVEHDVDFVVIGAQAALAHGVPLVTRDLGITPARDHTNVSRLAVALVTLDARLPTADTPEEIPFPPEAAILATGDSWTLITTAGELDVMFEPAGTGGFDDLRRNATRLRLGPDLVVAVAALPDVIRSKEAAGRPKDIAQLPIMCQTLEEIRSRERE